MKTYYLVKETGYRKCLKGRAVHVHDMFDTFYYIENGKYIIRCIKTSYLFGIGDTLKEAKLDALEGISRSGEYAIRYEIKKLIERQRPKGGRQK